MNLINLKMKARSSRCAVSGSSKAQRAQHRAGARDAQGAAVGCFRGLSRQIEIYALDVLP
jgi:hypothetical protein